MALALLADKQRLQLATRHGSGAAGDWTTTPSKTSSEPTIDDYVSPQNRDTASLFRPPAPPANFVGRDAERRQIQAAVQEGSVTTVGLFGREGVGKTALALVLVNQLTGIFPDGQIYIDLQGAAQPLAAPATMGQVIHHYDPLVHVPEDESAIQAAYRRVLIGRRVLLLLDNAANEAQLNLLAPPAGCLMLVTAGEQLRQPGLRALSLAGLPPEEAKQLLLNIAPRIRQHVDKLAGLCWQIPLALQLVGSALAAREDLDPGDYALRLMTEQFRQAQSGEVDALQAALTLSCQLLTPRQRRLWHQLGVFPVDFDQRAAAAVWALDVYAAEHELGELLRLSLVTFDPKLRRYRLHDRVRREARSGLKVSDRPGAQRWHAVYYVDVLAQADKFYAKGGAAMVRGLRLFDLERNNILAGQAWAAEHAQDDKAIAKLTSEYAAGGAHILALRQPLARQMAWYENAVQAARWLGDRKAEGGHLANLGSVCRHLGQPGRAIEYCEQYLRITREINDRPGEGVALEKLGLANAELGNTLRAAKYYEQSLGIARETSNRSDEARTSWNLGLAYEELGDLSAAIVAMQVCVDFERKIGHPNAELDAAEVETLRARLERHSRH